MKVFIAVFTLLISTSFVYSQPKLSALQVSANGHYLQRSADKPFFINACTAWSLTYAYTDQEVNDYLENRVKGKYNTVLLCAVFPEIVKTIADSAFRNQDFLQPVPRFWEHVDWVVKQATDKGLVVIINPIWKHSSTGIIHFNGPEKCRNFGQWFANRFKDNPNVIYFIGGNEAPEPVRAELDEMGRGIQEVYAGKAVVAYHSEAGQSGKKAFPDASWLTLNWTHAYSSGYKNCYPYSENYDNWKAYPKTPFFLAEGYYDFGDVKKLDENGVCERWGSRFVVRRQAWWNFLSGGAGNIYGAEGIWNKNSGGQVWSYCADYGSSQDMAVLELLTEKLKWWKLRPDVDHEILVSGYGTYMTDDYAVCAVSEDKGTAVIYTPVNQLLGFKLPDCGVHSRARWIDPVSGRTVTIDMRFPRKKKKINLFEPPPLNHSGSHDWILILEGIRPRK
jgi:hypothetical protein